MNLVFIYGPPAAGKFTVGSEVSQLTGFKFFHNHLTVDYVRNLFSDDHVLYSELLQEIRLAYLTSAARANIDMVFTLAYSGEIDDEWVAKIVDAVEENDSRVCFIQLNAPEEVLLERVGNESRVNMNKISTRERLQISFDTRDHFDSVKYDDILKIDTSKTSATDSARQIASYFGLPNLSIEDRSL